MMVLDPRLDLGNFNKFSGLSILTVAGCHSCFKFRSHLFPLNFFFILTNFKYDELSTFHACSL